MVWLYSYGCQEKGELKIAIFGILKQFLAKNSHIGTRYGTLNTKFEFSDMINFEQYGRVKMVSRQKMY
jgi:hypothetical protein